jgi:3-oxoacyl-[acyl-carrier protein] reductase
VVDVRNADHITGWAEKTDRAASAASILLFTNGGGPPSGAAISFDDAAWQNAVDLLLFSALRMVRAAAPSMTGARRRVDPDVHVGVGEGADPQPRALDRAARVGVGAVEDAGARARRDRIRVNQIIPAASTRTA